MNRKKHVVFCLNNQKQFYGEFHENSKVRLIKAYFRDISHIEEFNLVYNNEYILEEEICLKDVINGSSKTNIILNVEENKFNEIQEEKKATNNKIISVERTNEELITQMNSSKKEIEKLKNIIEELNINSSMLQKNIDNLQIQNFQLQKEKINLEQQAEEYRKEISELKRAKSSLEETSNKNNSASNQSHTKPRTSAIGNSLNETLNKIGNNTNISNSNANANMNVTPTSLNKRVSGLKTNTTGSSQSPYTFRSSLTQNSTLNRAQTMNISVTPEKNSNTANNLTRKSVQLNGNEIVNKSKEQEVNSDSIAKDYIEKKSQIEDVLSKPFKLQKNKSRSSNTNFEWGPIFSYMEKKDLINFSSTCKTNYKNSMSFLYDVMSEKKDKMEEYVKITNDYYKSILVEKRFELSLSTTSAIKILNRPSSIEIYSKDINYFSNPLILMCYQLLFQISKIGENAITLDIGQVLEIIRNTILTKMNTGYGLGDYIKSLASKACFDDENIEKIKLIMKKYDVKKIDLALMGKLCKITGMISFFLKDALSYCGLDNEKEKNIVKRRTRSGSMIKLLSDVDLCKIEKEKLAKNLPFLENLVKKF